MPSTSHPRTAGDLADLGLRRTGVPADQSQIRRTNLSLVLRTLREQGPTSRARLAAELGLNKATMSSLVAELEERRLVRPGSVERGGVGRPGRCVELDPTAVAGIGAEVNLDHITTMALSLTGEVLHEQRRSVDARIATPEDVADHLADAVAATADEVSALGADAIATTVGVAGLIDRDRELVTLAPNLGWREVPFASMLRERLGGTVAVVDNEANLAARAEFAAGDPQREEMLVVYGDVGVGGAIVSGGRLLRGSRGYAGEVGHMLVEPSGRRCACGRVGCWETVIGVRALLDSAADPDDPVHDPALSLPERLALLAHRANAGDARTLAALHRVAAWIGAGVATLAHALNPALLVLSGWFAVLGAWLRDVVADRLADVPLAPVLGGTRVELSTHGFAAVVRGGALASLDLFCAHPTHVPRGTALITGGAR